MKVFIALFALVAVAYAGGHGETFRVVSEAQPAVETIRVERQQAQPQPQTIRVIKEQQQPQPQTIRVIKEQSHPQPQTIRVIKEQSHPQPQTIRVIKQQAQPAPKTFRVVEQQQSSPKVETIQVVKGGSGGHHSGGHGQSHTFKVVPGHK